MAFERNENMNEFEEFLKESSDEFQMNPSDRVWNAVRNELHTTPKWPYYTLALIFISLGILTNINQYQKSQSSNTIASKLNQQVLQIQSEASNTVRNSSIKGINSGRDNSYTKSKTHSKNITFILDKNSYIIASNAKRPDFKVKSNTSPTIATTENILRTTAANSTIVVQNSRLPDLNQIDFITMPQNKKREFSFIKEFMLKQPNLLFNSIGISASKNPKQSFKISGEQKNNKLSLASVSKKYRKKAWTVYFSPAVSYRKLRGSAQFFNNYSFTRTDVNSAVRHLPMMGLELGSALIFNPQNKIRFKIGLQFNLNQYDIKAYSAVPEVTSLSVSGIGQAPIRTIAYHRNFDGFKETWLKNKHIMVSIPMATEIRVIGDQRISLNIAAGIQPTYMLSENPYLISSNLKNYAKAPSGLIRNFNVNGSMESFISFKSGNLRWTMGPQFRYQLLSNFKKTYPFTEHLTDFGFKVGVIKNFK